MILAVALSENGGMTFNKRRLSRDRELIRNLISLSHGGRLCISEFSRKLFFDVDSVIVTDSSDTLSEEDVFFCERAEDLPRGRVSSVIIYRWNEVYPADVRFNYDMSAYALAESMDFEGYSHKKITREIWKPQG